MNVSPVIILLVIATGLWASTNLLINKCSYLDEKIIFIFLIKQKYSFNASLCLIKNSKTFIKVNNYSSNKLYTS